MGHHRSSCNCEYFHKCSPLNCLLEEVYFSNKRADMCLVQVFLDKIQICTHIQGIKCLKSESTFKEECVFMQYPETFVEDGSASFGGHRSVADVYNCHRIYTCKTGCIVGRPRQKNVYLYADSYSRSVSKSAIRRRFSTLMFFFKSTFW